MIRRPPRSTLSSSSAASDVYKRQGLTCARPPKGTAVPLLTILTACCNEEGNVREVYQQVKAAMETVPTYDYEHLFIDNASTDATVAILRELAAADKRVKVIVNTRNFGHVRSPYHAFLQARGDAVMSCVADLQDPPELIPEFVKKWEEGFKVVIGVKRGTRESWPKLRVFTMTLTRLSAAASSRRTSTVLSVEALSMN